MKILVTGGGGFLGGAIVTRLLNAGHEVFSFARGAYPELTARGVTCIQGDLADATAVHAAVDGCDLVYHVAAKAGVWGDYESYHTPNVIGTKNILDACRSRGVPRLVYTSSPSVIFTGTDESGLDESTPYPEQYLCAYPATKAEAERLVLAANSDSLKTVALRPHLIWGPGDTQLVPRVVSRAKAGRLRIVGSGENKVDTVYIDNAADAHILAAEELAGEAKCAGKAYFITNGEPVAMRTLLNKILAAANVPPVTRSISVGAAYAVGVTMEFVYKLLKKQEEPLMTRFVARQLSTAHWYDISASQRDFGYTPQVDIATGMARLKEWFDNNKAE